MKYFSVIIFLFFSRLMPAQKNDKLSMGDKIPFSRVAVVGQDKKATNIDLPNGKTMNDRFVLVYFYSASTSTKELIAFNNDTYSGSFQYHY